MIGTIFMTLFLGCLFAWLVMCLYVLVWTLGTIALFFLNGAHYLLSTFMKAEGWDD